MLLVHGHDQEGLVGGSASTRAVQFEPDGPVTFSSDLTFQTWTRGGVETSRHS